MSGRSDWAAVLRGERAALEELFARWMPVTLQWCRRLGGPRIDAEQAAQEVFLVVLRRVHTVPAEEVFPTWLFEVTRRVLSQQRRLAWVRLWDASSRASARLDRSRSAEQSEHREVWQILEQLSPQLKEVLVLCDIEGRTDPEVAGLLDVPVGTVKSRLRRAREQFRQAAVARGLVEEGT